MKMGNFATVVLILSNVASAGILGDHDFKPLDTDFAAPIVFSKSAINAPAAGSIVYETSGGGGFFGLPPGVNPVNSANWVPLGLSGGQNYFQSSEIQTCSAPVTSTTPTTFSNSPGFTFTPSVSGKYKVYGTANLAAQTPGTAGGAQIINSVGGATQLAMAQGIVYASSDQTISTAFLQSVFQLKAGQSYQFDVQGYNLLAGGAGVVWQACNGATYLFAELLP